MVDQKRRMSPEAIRAAVLITLVLQNSAQALFMRSSFRKDKTGEDGEEEPGPASSTAVVMAEVCKLVASFILQRKEDGSGVKFLYTLQDDLLRKPLDMLKMAVPACLYVAQNNLNYVAISNLDGPTFQLLYQLKILTTALFSVFMLNKVLVLRQWAALAMLALGVGLVQISGKKDTGNDDQTETDAQRPLLGFAAVMMACCTSGFAGVYFEKVLKGATISLWIRNIQLSSVGILLGIFIVWKKDGQSVAENGFFYKYDFSVWMAVLLNSLGGLVVAMVVKYADNVIKGFATSVSIVLTALVSMVLFDFSMSLLFIVGAYLVLHSTFLYSQKPPANSQPPSVPATGPASKEGAKEGEVEMIPEAETLLSTDATKSPRVRRGSGQRDGGTL